MTDRRERPTISDQTGLVRTFYDQEAGRYLPERYLTPGCEQFSYLSRKRIALDMLRSEGGPLLDIGCGPAVLTADLVAMRFHVVCVDLSLEMLRAAQARNACLPGAPSRYGQGDVANLPFRSSSFGCSVGIGVLGYVLDARTALREIHRVLRPGGVAILQTSNSLCPAAIVARWLRRTKRLLTHSQAPYGFRLTGHRPARFIRLITESGFVVEDSAFYDFRVPFLDHVWPSGALALGRSLQRFERRTRVAWLGEGMVVKARKS